MGMGMGTGYGGIGINSMGYGLNRNRNKEENLGLSPMAAQLIQRAMAAQANAPTLQSLFPGMAMPSQFTSPMANLTGQFGANRFLGQGVNQLGNPSMMGFSPNTTINK